MGVFLIECQNSININTNGMKVILLKNVPKLGKKYEVKDVSDGYATNLLIPQGHAQIATEGNVKRVLAMKTTEDVEKKIHEDLLIKNIHDLQGIEIVVEEKANDKGHLFAGLHTEELVPLIKAQTRLDIAPEYIKLEKPIKEVGEHEVEVGVQDHVAKFKVVVKAKE